MSYSVRQDHLNRMNRAAQDAKLGDVVADLTANLNAALTDLAALKTKYASLLAHLDTANVAGIGNANAATYTPAASTAKAVTTIDQR